jgi:SAM-dependent methyltransferase
VTEAAGHPYDRHVGRYGPQLADGLIRSAGLSDARRVVDVGCGTGQLTAKLAEALGPEGVAGVDPNESVVAVARARVPGADVRVGSAERLPFADRSFDAALAQLVVNLVDDPPTAVREMARVTERDGVVAACFWDDQEMPLLRSFWDAAQAAAPSALAEVDTQAQVGLANLGVLVEWWGQAGLRSIELGDFTVSAAYRDFDDLWAPFASGVGHSGSLYMSLDPETQASMRRDAWRRLGSPRESFELAARVRWVRGVV